ncbi:ABC transporter substrate-binding protein [Streptomyces sp. LHD-70]|uniref:ABC transporter substrate-binding protein n=1 Tax=Streptomyces sp. LHD-70 TaxID=3072140 RepID=UPI00280DE0E7|nr:ABC transporter substrate-binding protein [Streptomyces sp. LHD-70]MDQ8706115.1 ABC transporter substrate-binding protein [Streptomyces sp. LHD-70]
MRQSIRLPALTVGLTLVALLTTAGCTDASAEGDGAAPKAKNPAATVPEVEVDEAAAALLPAEVKTKGTLVVASDASYRPFEYFDTDNKTITGFDIDLTDVLGAKLGLKVRHVNAGFDSILPGLAAKKYDIGASAFSVTPERAKTVDFVTYLRGGTGIAVKTGNPLGLKMAPKSLCGHAVSAQKGSVQGLSQLPEISKSCAEAGRKPVAIELFPSQDGANLAVVSGRVDAVMADTISLAMQAEASGGKFELVDGPLYAPDRYGLAVPKNSPLKPALEAAVKAILSDGTMDALMKKWQISGASRIKGGS